MNRSVSCLFGGLVALALFAGAAQAEELKTYQLSLKGTAFTPAELKVPAGQPFVIEFTNENAAPAELESSELGIEKVAPGNGKAMIRVKGLRQGAYGFVNEFQEDEAKGKIIAE